MKVSIKYLKSYINKVIAVTLILLSVLIYLPGKTYAANGVIGVDLPPISQADITTAVTPITIDVNNNWAHDIGTNPAKTNILIDNMIPRTELSEWKKIVDTGITIDPIDPAFPTKLTINLPQTLAYNITTNQIITMTLPSILFEDVPTSPVPSPKITITANPQANLSGTLYASTNPAGDTTQTDIVTGGGTIIINLTNETWKADVASNTTQRNLLFDSFSTTIQIPDWDNVIAALKIADPAKTVVLVDAKTLKITFPPVADFDISDLIPPNSQTIDLNIDPALLFSGLVLTQRSFDIYPDTPRGTADWGGVAPNITEEDIISGNRVITITIQNGNTWALDAVTNPTKLNALLSGFKASSNSDKWDLVMKAIKDNPSMVIDPIDPSILSITLPSVPDYNLITDQTIKLTIPKTVLGSASSVDINVATPLVVLVPQPTTAMKSIDIAMTDGTLSDALINYSLKEIRIFAPKRFINTISINPTSLANITTIDVLTDPTVPNVNVKVSGNVLPQTTPTIMSDGQRKFSFAFIASNASSSGDVIVSALDSTGGKMQKDIPVKLTKTKKDYPSKKDLIGAYSLDQLVSNSTLLKSLLTSYDLDELIVGTP